MPFEKTIGNDLIKSHQEGFVKWPTYWHKYGHIGHIEDVKATVKSCWPLQPLETISGGKFGARVTQKGP